MTIASNIYSLSYDTTTKESRSWKAVHMTHSIFDQELWQDKDITRNKYITRLASFFFHYLLNILVCIFDQQLWCHQYIIRPVLNSVANISNIPNLVIYQYLCVQVILHACSDDSASISSISFSRIIGSCAPTIMHIASDATRIYFQLDDSINPRLRLPKKRDR